MRELPGRAACRFAGQMASRTAYDEVRYSNYPYAQTHPDRLATRRGAARAAGAGPARRARVLELGCGAGGNLLAMAAATPGICAGSGSTSPHEPIAEGRARDRGGRGRQRRVPPGRRRRPARRRARRVRLRDRPRRLRLGPRAGARRAAGRDPRAPRGRTGSRTSPTTPTPAATCAGRCARPGCGSRRGEPGPTERAERAQELYRFLMEQRAGTGDWWGALLREPAAAARSKGPVYRLVHDDLERVLGARVVRRLRRARGAATGSATSATRTSRNLLPDRAAGRRRAEPARARRRATGSRASRSPTCCAATSSASPCCAGTAGRRADDPTPDAMYGAALRRRGRASRRGAERACSASALELLRSRAPGDDRVRRAAARRSAPTPTRWPRRCSRASGPSCVMPHVAPLRIASGRGRVDRPVASRLARWQARTGADVTSLAYTTVHMEEPAARLLIDAARRHARPGGDPGRVHRAHRRAAERRGPRRQPRGARAPVPAHRRAVRGLTLRRCRARARAGAARCRTAARAGRARARRRGGGRRGRRATRARSPS